MADSGRLATTVLPRSYDLLVSPDLETCRYTGRVEIALEITEPTSAIELHAVGLDVELELLEAGIDAPDRVAATLRLDPERERVAITTDRPLPAGQARLALRFGGAITDSLVGFYRSRYIDDEGRTRVIAATQFEAPHARRAFPCFDEPEFKAVFRITLDVADDLLAISNGAETGREPARDGRVRVRFADTIPLSTYLVAWVIGPLRVTEPVDAGGVAVRVVHVPGREHLTAFALDVASFAIRFFADYYGIPYPGEKCDLVALPDFAFGAMENLGCVTFRETRLLLDPGEVTLDEMSGAAQTIVHEIAHMWFGDLVTMKWWNGIWLNEAFATFMEHLGVDAYRPEWRTWVDLAVGRAAALDIDAVSTTRSVEYEVHTPADADGMFDVLTYQKGGSVLRMLEQWLGADAFRAGVRLYLNRYELANTETTDLWDALEEATGKPVRRIMDSWIFQPGFPVLEPDTTGVAQRRFLYTSDVVDDTRWVVPLVPRAADGDTAVHALLLEDERVALRSEPERPTIVNGGGQGFFRVAYPSQWRARLLDSGRLDVLERFTVVDDLWAFVLAGSAEAIELLDVARRLRGEDDLVVWRVLCAHLRTASRLLAGDALDRWRDEVRAIVTPAATRLGWEPRPGEDPRTRQLRGVLVAMLGSFLRDPETVARARETDARGGSDPDVAAACVGIVAASGTPVEFERFVRRATSDGTSPHEQQRYLYALGEFPAEELVLEACRLAISGEIRTQSGPFVVQRALRNRDHGPAAWVSVRDHWDELRARFTGTLTTRAIEGATWLVDDVSSADVPSFLAAHPVPEGTKVIAQHMERLRVHRATLVRERERFPAALLAGA